MDGRTRWPELALNGEEIAFGADTHDIGKIKLQNELHKKGKRHQQVGYHLLLEIGVEEPLARFALTHGSWVEEEVELEDLIVALADKIWKAKRIPELEEKLIQKIAGKLQKDYWEIDPEIEKIISAIMSGADQRISWQAGGR